jgi:membrane protein YqaA with SNARE-associated domain
MPRHTTNSIPDVRNEDPDHDSINWLSMIREIVSGGNSDETPEERRQRRRANVPARIAAVILSVGITVGIILLRDRLTDLSLYGYPGIFLINLIGNATIILPAPAFAAVFAAGGALNPVLLGVFAGLGSALGEMTGYLAGVGGRSVIENRGLYDRLEAWMRKAGVFAIFVMAAIPNPVFDVGGMVAGALRMPVPRFLIACWAGKTVRMILVALVGQMLIAP